MTLTLTQCPECNNEISGKANWCPHCGHPVNMTCPKCGLAQPYSDTCIGCEIVIAKYKPTKKTW